MSEAFYIVRVYFDNDRGTARVPGKIRHFTSPPVIPGIAPFDAIDYAPGAVAMLREPMHGWRDMETYEIRAARRWLDAMTSD